MNNGALPPKQGCTTRNEHDACGVGFVAHIKGENATRSSARDSRSSNACIIRGAVGADPRAGDGAGLLLQIPDAFSVPWSGSSCRRGAICGRHAVPAARRRRCAPRGREDGRGIRRLRRPDGARVARCAGRQQRPGYSVLPTEPVIRQVFVGCGKCADQEAFERKLS